MAKKSTAKKPVKKASAKKATAKKVSEKKTPKKNITEIFPNLIPVTELETEKKETKKAKGSKKPDLSTKETRKLEEQLNICENQIINHMGTPVEAHYTALKNDILEKLGRTSDAPHKRN